MQLVEFVVFGTPTTSKGEARRLWQIQIAEEARKAMQGNAPSVVDALVLRIAYFFVNSPAGDLDNIVKPIQDALKEIVYLDDIQVVDLVASMRDKASDNDLEMSPDLMRGFFGGSDFVHVTVNHSSRIEVYQ